MQTDREILGVDDLADFLGVNRKTVLEYAGKGDIPHRRLGRRILFSRAAIMEWAKGRDIERVPREPRIKRKPRGRHVPKAA